MNSAAAKPTGGLPQRLRPAVAAIAQVVTNTACERDGLTAEVVDGVDEILATFPPHLRWGLLLGLSLFEFTARLWPSARLRPFSRVAPPAALRIFSAWWHSPVFAIRQWAKGIKSLVALVYWDHPHIRERIGFTPEAWIAKVAARRLASYGPQIAAHRDRVLAPSPLTQWRGGGSAGGVP